MCTRSGVIEEKESEEEKEGKKIMLFMVFEASVLVGHGFYLERNMSFPSVALFRVWHVTEKLA